MSTERKCIVCGCTDAQACSHHRDRGVNGCWGYDDASICTACEHELAADPLLRQVLRARMERSRRHWPGPVARYVRMTAYDHHDILFCAVQNAGESALDPVVYRARLILVAALCLDLAQAIDLQLAEKAS